MQKNYRDEFRNFELRHCRFYFNFLFKMMTNCHYNLVRCRNYVKIMRDVCLNLKSEFSVIYKITNI